MAVDTADAYGEIAWQEIVTHALLGTGRGTFALPSVDGPLASLFEQFSSASNPPENMLLEAVAALTLYRRAGRLPALDESALPDPAPPEELPYCSPRAGHRLLQMLGGVHNDLLGEWLQAAAKAGKLAPPECVAALLTLARSREELRESALRVTGRRGGWLARFNPDWSYALGEVAPSGDAEADRELWETGAFETRVGVLRRLRPSDPSSSRELLTLTWNSERADHRARFLGTFHQGLSMDDEPFLEAALNDRSKDVRSHAANLLSRLPESQLVGRLKALALPLLTFRDVKQRGFLGVGASDKSFIEVVLPQECTAAMKRDGIEPKSVPPGMGEKAWWLQQMLRCIPPSVWESAWGVDAERIITAAAQTKEWGELLTNAWISAAWLHKDIRWAEAFFKHGDAISKTYRSKDMLSMLPPEGREAHVLDTLRRKPDALYSTALPLDILWQLESPWSYELSLALLVSVKIYMASDQGNRRWEILHSLGEFARQMTPQIREEAERILMQKNADRRPGVTEMIDTFLATLQFRRQMLEELAQ